MLRFPFFVAYLIFTFAWFPSSAQPEDVTDDPSKRVLSEDSVFATLIELPARFSMGLAKTPTGFVVSDRHEDLLIFFDDSGRRIKTVAYPAYEPSALSFDGSHLIAADAENGRIYFVDPESAECVHHIQSPIRPVSAVACDDQGRLWVAASRFEEIQLVDPKDGTTLASIQAPSAKITAISFDSNGYLWVADSAEDKIFLVDIGTGYTVFSLKAPGPVANGLWVQGKDLYVTDYQTDMLYRGDVGGLQGRCVRSDKRKGHATLFSEVENLGPGVVTGGKVVIAIPEDGPNQSLDSISYTDGAKLTEDQWGQKVAVYDIGELQPGEKKSIRLDGVGTFYRVSYKVYPHLVGPLDDIPSEIRSTYLVDADKYRVTGDFIQGKVKEIVGDEENPYFAARKLYDFLIGRINYQMIGGWDIAPTVIERGTGSCSEYTFSYVSLCRAAGIPARYVGAMVLRGEDASVDTAYHRWAEIYLPKVGWIPVDVNAGDRQWQGDRCFSFGGIANRFLITTRGGGDSNQLSWGYNLKTSYRTKGKANVRTEGFAEWDVVD